MGKCPTCGMYKVPSLAVDGVILDEKDNIVLIKRVNEPFKNQYALPGGFVEYGEEVASALVREMKEETDLNVEPIRIIGVFSKPNRDPRSHVISIAFECRIISGKLKAGDNAKDGKVVNIHEAMDMKLAFDHNKILRSIFRRKYLASF